MNDWKHKGQLINHLSDCGLLSPQSVTDGSLTVEDQSSRNMNFLVNQKKPVFVKVALDLDRNDSLQTEAKAYQHTHLNGQMREQILPTMLHHQSQKGVLVTEAIQRATYLTDILTQPTEYNLQAAGHTLGKALQQLALSDRKTFELAETPWAFSMYAPEKSTYFQFSSATQELIRLIQQNKSFVEHLRALNDTWTSDGVSHFDLKAENVLYTRQESGKLLPRIVDWEMVCQGDMCWDLASVWASVIKTWLDSVELGKQEMNASKKVDALFDFNRAMWKSYSGKLSAHRTQSTLEKTMRFTGVALLKLNAELTELSMKLNQRNLLYLQTSHNLICHPLQAAKALLGINPRIS